MMPGCHCHLIVSDHVKLVYPLFKLCGDTSACPVWYVLYCSLASQIAAFNQHIDSTALFNLFCSRYRTREQPSFPVAARPRARTRFAQPCNLEYWNGTFSPEKDLVCDTPSTLFCHTHGNPTLKRPTMKILSTARREENAGCENTKIELNYD